MHEPETSRLRMGLVPLVDCAPVVVARERGFFARHGLDVILSVEGSWAGIRDKLAAGLLDAAQVLAPMPLAAQLGLDGFGVPLVSALTLSRNGNMITVSNALHAALASAGPDATAKGQALHALLAQDRAEGRRPRVLAHVYPHSSHHFLLRVARQRRYRCRPRSAVDEYSAAAAGALSAHRTNRRLLRRRALGHGGRSGGRGP